MLVDGESMPEDEARAFWKRFSDWMEAHRGDLQGFATQEGFRSVHPETRQGQAVLVASRSDAQRAYGPARSGSGSGGSQGGGGRGGGSGKKRGNRR